MYINKEEYEKNMNKDNSFLFGMLNGDCVMEMGNSIFNTEPKINIFLDDYADIFKDGAIFRHISAGTEQCLGRIRWHGITLFFKFPRNALKTVY